MRNDGLWIFMEQFCSIYSLFRACSDAWLPAALCWCTRTYIQYMHTIDVFGELENTKLRLLPRRWMKEVHLLSASCKLLLMQNIVN